MSGGHSVVGSPVDSGPGIYDPGIPGPIVGGPVVGGASHAVGMQQQQVGRI